MSSEKPTQYRSILKGISLFGGVKVFEILINLIRGKFVALFLGPEGMGVNAIFSNSTTTLSQLSSLGLNLAIAKEVAVRKEDKGKLQEIIEVTLRLTLLTALAGGVVCVLFSAWLSELSFGTDAYRWQFMLLGIAVFLFVSNGSRLAMLQGLHEVKRLSRASLVGSVTGLLAGVPLYWLFGTHGIVPAIIILALSLHIFYTVNLRKSVTGVSFRTFPAKLSLKGDTPLVKRLLSLGIILVAGDVIANICNYLLIIFVRESGGLDSVGLYQSSASVTNQMASVVFAAMAMDYFPRLSACSADNEAMMLTVNRQTEITTWVLLPLSLLLVAVSPLVISLLFTSEFEEAVPLLRLMSIGVLLKALSIPMGYISIVKENKRLYFRMECIFANLLTLAALGGGYLLFGLDGLGWGMIAEQGTLIVVYYIVNRRLYDYRFSAGAARALGAAIAGGALITAESLMADNTLRITAMAATTVAAIGISIYMLRNILKA